MIPASPPTPETEPGDHIAAFCHRRHMTKGQRAMAVAMVHPKAPMGRGAKDPAKGPSNLGLSGELVRQARAVLAYAGELAGGVLSGSTPLESAYEVARDRKAKSTAEKAQMDELQASAPDLAALVTEKRMGLAEALAAMRVRQSDANQKIADGQSAAQTALLVFSTNVQTIQAAIALGGSIDEAAR